MLLSAVLFLQLLGPWPRQHPPALFRDNKGHAILRVRYARSVTVAGVPFYRTTSRLRHFRNPTAYPVRFPFRTLAYTDSAVLTYTSDAATYPLRTSRGLPLEGGVQTLFRFGQVPCREYVYEDRVNIFSVCLTQKYYAPAYDDTLYVYQLRALSWLSGTWLPHECRVSKKSGIVSFTLSILPNDPRLAKTAYPGYDPSNDLTFVLAPPATAPGPRRRDP